MRRNRYGWMLVAATILASPAAVGCTSTPSTPPAERFQEGAPASTPAQGGAAGAATGADTISWNQIDEPALIQAEPSAFVAAATVSDDSRGWFGLAGFRMDTDLGRARPTIWTSESGEFAAVEDDVFGSGSGAVADLVAANGELVGAGAVVNERQVVPEVWMRNKAKEWTVGAPELGDIQEAIFTAVGAGQGRDYIAAGMGTRDGAQVGVVSRGTADSAWTVTPLGDSHDLTPTAVVSNRKATVIVGNERSDKGTRPTAWVSTDDGATWREVEEGSLGTAGSGRATTAEVVDDQFLVFGTTTDGSAITLWTSSDGERWTEEPALIEGKPVEAVPHGSTVDGTRVLLSALPSSGGSFPVAFGYTPGSGWRELRIPLDPDATYPPTGAGPLAAGPSGVLLVIPVPRSVELILAAEQNAYIQPGSDAFPPSSPSLTGSVVAATADGLAVGGTRGPIGDMTSRSFSPVAWTGTAGSLARHDLEDVTTIRAAAVDADGKVVLTGLRAGTGERTADSSDNNDIWVGTLAPSGDLTLEGTIGGPGEQTSSNLFQHDGRWYLTGRSVESSSAQHSEGMVWTSTDLATWTPDTGDFTDVALNAVCAAGDRLILVGSEQDDRRVAHPMAWTRDASGAWAPLADRAGLPSGAGSFSGCATGPTGTWVIGTVDQRPVVRFTTDGTGLTTVAVADERYVSMSGVAASPEGVVIVGSDRRQAINRPILWSSRDGSRWVESVGPVDPSITGAGALDVVFQKDQVLVLGAVSLSTVIWSIDHPFGAAGPR